MATANFLPIGALKTIATSYTLVDADPDSGCDACIANGNGTLCERLATLSCQCDSKVWAVAQAPQHLDVANNRLIEIDALLTLVHDDYVEGFGALKSWHQDALIGLLRHLVGDASKSVVAAMSQS